MRTGELSNRIVPQTILLVLLVMAGRCGGDEILKKDGTVLRGSIRAESEKKVYIQLNDGSSNPIGVWRENIASIRRGAEGPTSGPATRPGARPQPPVIPGDDKPRYYYLPVKGVVGVDVIGEGLGRALQNARSLTCDRIILHINSPGGMVQEMDAIVEVLIQNKDLPIVAYVEDALSAAAILTLACKDIYMAPKGTIGGAVSYTRDEQGIPKEVDAKFKSIFLAKCRTAATAGEHSPLFVSAMGETDSEVWLTVRDGKPLVTEQREDPGSRILKGRGKILTLTADEALICGLTKGIVARLDDVYVRLGNREWRVIKDPGTAIMEETARKGRAANYMREIAPALAGIEAQLVDVRTKGRAAEANKKNLISQYKAEAAPIETIFAKEVRAAEEYTLSNRDLAQAMWNRAKAKRDAAISYLDAAYQLQFVPVNAAINNCVSVQKTLLAERDKLLAKRNRLLRGELK